jgi:hypothetical protein
MDSVRSLPDNPVYRLTDLICRKGIRWEEDRATILGNREYRDTILYDYLSLLRSEEDMNLFRRVVRKHQERYSLPPADCLVVHLRLGDVMDDHEDQRWRSFERSLSLYSHLCLPSLPRINKAIIVTALHFGANDLNGKYFYSEKAASRSYQVLDRLSETLSSHGLSVAIQSSENVDADFCFMAASRYFLKGISGLSDLVCECLPYGALVWTPGSRVVSEKARFPRLRNRARRIKQLLIGRPGPGPLR